MDVQVGAWLLTSDAERFPGGPAHLLANPGGWLYSGKLRRYGLPFYGHWGTLEIALDWGALLADVDAGKLETYVSNRQEQTAGMLRVAASLAGHGQVCLADVERLLTGDELERLREQLAKLWAT